MSMTEITRYCDDYHRFIRNENLFCGELKLATAPSSNFLFSICGFVEILGAQYG